MADTRAAFLDRPAEQQTRGATDNRQRLQSALGRPSRFSALLAVAAISVPFAILAARLIAFGRGYFPFFDHAWLELDVRDVASHPPLVGSYSRFGFFHPGPALFWCLALPYRLFGSAGLSVGALILNGASVAGIALVARRRGGTPLLLIALALVSLMLRALGAGFWQDPWNPYVIVLPTALLMLLVWSLCLGERWAWPLALGVASFGVQAHIGIALPTVALLTYAGWRFTVARRRRKLIVPDVEGDREHGGRRVALASVAVVGVLWLPPLIDVVIHGGGNAAAVLDFFARSPSGQSISTAWHGVAQQLNLQPQWLVGPTGAALIGRRLSRGDVPLLLIAVVPVIWSAARRRDREVLELAGAVGLAIVVSVIATKAIVGLPYSYLVRWNWSVGLALGLLVVWGAWTALPSARTIVIALAAGTLVVASALNVTAAIHQSGPQADSQVAVRTLTRETLRAVPRNTSVLLRSSPGTFQPSLVLALARAGLDVRVPRSEAFAFPSRFTQRGAPPARQLLVLIGTPERVRHEIARRGGRVVASWHGAPPEEIRRGLLAGGELLRDHADGRDARAALRNLHHQLRAFAAAVVSLER